MGFIFYALLNLETWESDRKKVNLLLVFRMEKKRIFRFFQ